MLSIVQTSTKAVIGTSSSVATVVLANLEEITGGVRLTGMIIGVLVAALSAISISLDIRRKWREHRSRK